MAYVDTSPVAHLSLTSFQIEDSEIKPTTKLYNALRLIVNRVDRCNYPTYETNATNKPSSSTPFHLPAVVCAIPNYKSGPAQLQLSDAGRDQLHVADLSHKTRRLVGVMAMQDVLGGLTKTVTFDIRTLDGLRSKPRTDEGKAFNLVRSLQKEMEDDPDIAQVLQSLRERAGN